MLLQCSFAESMDHIALQLNELGRCALGIFNRTPPQFSAFFTREISTKAVFQMLSTKAIHCLKLLLHWIYITFACRLFNPNHSMVSVYTANGIGFVEALANASGIEGIRSFDFGATINSL